MKKVKLHQFIYEGPYRKFNNGPWDRIRVAVQSESLRRAESKIKSQIRDKLGLVPSVPITIQSNKIKLVPDQELEDVLYQQSRETCPKCGTPLNDGGYCVVCDDGEEDY